TIFAMPFAMIGFALGVFGWNKAYSIPGLVVQRADIIPPPTVDDSVIPNSGKEYLVRLLLVIGCMVFARSAAMAFNRWLDVQFDALNPRTAIREIPAGIILKKRALRFVAF